jgi:hypothetical protein
MSALTVKQRRLIIRASLVVIWIALGVALFLLNRGHALLVDNHSVESLNLRAPDRVKVSVDKSKSLEFFRKDRDIFELGGGKHIIRVEFNNGTPAFEKQFSLPLKDDMYLLSIPKLINNIEPYFEVFHTMDERPQDDDGEIKAEIP